MMAAAKISPGGLLRNSRMPRWRPAVQGPADDAADDVADGGADQQADDPAGAERIGVVADLVAEQRAEEDDDEADALDEDHAVPAGRWRGRRAASSSCHSVMVSGPRMPAAVPL